MRMIPKYTISENYSIQELLVPNLVMSHLSTQYIEYETTDGGPTTNPKKSTKNQNFKISKINKFNKSNKIVFNEKYYPEKKEEKVELNNLIHYF
jgi:hypothetical protein